LSLTALFQRRSGTLPRLFLSRARPARRTSSRWRDQTVSVRDGTLTLRIALALPSVSLIEIQRAEPW